MMNTAKHIAPDRVPTVLCVKQTTSLIDSRFTLNTTAIIGTGTATITAGGTIINFSTAQNVKFRYCRINIGGQSRFITTFNSTTQANIDTGYNSEGVWATSATSVVFTWTIVTAFSGQTGDNGIAFVNSGGNSRCPFLAFKNNKVCCKFWADTVATNKYFTFGATSNDFYAQGTSGYSLVVDAEIVGSSLQYGSIPFHIGRTNFWQVIGANDGSKAAYVQYNETASNLTIYNVIAGTNTLQASKFAYSIAQNGKKFVFDNYSRNKSIETRSYLTYDSSQSSIMGHRGNGYGHSETYLYTYWGFSSAIPEKNLERLLERIKQNKY